MTKEHRIKSVTDFLSLTEEEFGRMLPDLAAWYVFAKKAEAAGLRSIEFIWIDDGEPGVISRVEVRIGGGE